MSHRKTDRRQGGAGGWHAFFSAQFGPERWVSLHKVASYLPMPSLGDLTFLTGSCGSQSPLLLNAHANQADIADAVAAFDPALCAISASPAPDLQCMLAGPSCTPGLQFPIPPIDRAGRRIYYPLDYASVLSVSALRVNPGCSVLDVCAAPGGKSIAITQSLKSSGFLVCNEPDVDRRRRLMASLKEHCSEATFVRVRVCGYDGTQWPLLKKQISAEGFERILVDAPCSSDRHLAHAPQQLAQWSHTHVTQASMLQAKLLASAIRCAAAGAHVVYSTCALSESENDGAVEGALLLLSKLNLGGGQVAPEVEVQPGGVTAMRLGMGEATRHGVLILPDTCNGWGPLSSGQVVEWLQAVAAMNRSVREVGLRKEVLTLEQDDQQEMF